MGYEQQWRWIKQNRRIPVRTERLFAPAARVLDRASTGAPGKATRLAEAVAGFMDDDFHEVCAVQSVEHGTLIVAVRNRAFLGIARLKWALDLLEGVQKACPDCHIRQVQFTPAASADRRSTNRDSTRRTR